MYRLRLTEEQFWYDTTPRKLLAMIEQSKKAETETAILNAYAVKVDDPRVLRGEDDDVSLDGEAAWDNW